MWNATIDLESWKISQRWKAGNGAISTASLLDIVFMLLFFFMVATVPGPRKRVTVIRPEATELYTRLRKSTLIRYINIGKPLDKRYGTTKSFS